MAAADYYLCDVCGSKTFYDGGLQYEDYYEKIKDSFGVDHPWPNGVGDMAVLCEKCALTHEVKIVKSMNGILK